MCGGTAQTTQQVAIPPEVMQNYRAVNARATEVAATPFQQYSTDPNAFVAPINQAQQTGMNAISAAGGVAQPYFQGATQQLMGGQAAATPYYGEATQQLLGGLNAGVTGTQAAYQPLQQGAQAAQGTPKLAWVLPHRIMGRRLRTSLGRRMLAVPWAALP